MTPTITPATTQWKTYVNTKLHLAVGYPPDWVVHETNVGARFTSPQGAIIELTEIDTHNQSPEDYLLDTQLPNTRCSTTTNPHQIPISNCRDTITASFYANLILKSSGNLMHLVTLSTRSKDINAIFEQMVASARLVQ